MLERAALPSLQGLVPHRHLPPCVSPPRGGLFAAIVCRPHCCLPSHVSAASRHGGGGCAGCGAGRGGQPGHGCRGAVCRRGHAVRAGLRPPGRAGQAGGCCRAPYSSDASCLPAEQSLHARRLFTTSLANHPHLPQGDEADRHKLRTAALKLRLAQLTKERRAREAAEAAAFQARQRELDR